ncbi:ribosomal RNA large subunit methyltransferase N [Dehalogenimonas sp. WBC-2]|nr:ribosomal RNA large subunit methyltransferase N [Dehalogenimonas sp. WBC-2]
MNNLSSSPLSILGMTTKELRAIASAEGAEAFRGNQMAEWLYHRGVHSFNEMANLPEMLRNKLEAGYTIGRSRCIKTQRASDQTVKLLLETTDGGRLESVGLPYKSFYSCCVSTQIGCPIHCAFCATGQSGFKRDCTAGEIIDQVLSINETALVKQSNQVGNSIKTDHVTFMGMGEPLLNYDQTIKALRLLIGEMDISARHLTVSTIGHVTNIRRLAREGIPVTLAISLHAPNDDLRHELIPSFTRWTINEIIESGQDYVSRTGRRLTIEYCLLEGVNDHKVEAQQLAQLLRGINCHVNLIPFNPVEGLPFKTSSPQRVVVFKDTLIKLGIQVTERARRGVDIDAACGQLRGRSEN